MRGWEGVWEGKEEGAKTGNFAKVPSSVTCAAATERKRTSVARVTERQKKQGKLRGGLSFSSFKSRGSRDVKTRLHIKAETRTRLSQQERSNKDSQAACLYCGRRIEGEIEEKKVERKKRKQGGACSHQKVAGFLTVAFEGQRRNPSSEIISTGPHVPISPSIQPCLAGIKEDRGPCGDEETS